MRIDPRLALPLIVLALGAVAAVLIVITRPAAEVSPAAPSAPLVQVQRVAVGSVRLRVRAHGTVTPRTESDLTAEVTGRVAWVSPGMVSGGFFTENEPLLRIDAHDYEVALERARASVTRSESLQVLTRKELERQKKLAGRSVASEANLDAAANAERAAEAGLREARAALSQAERDLARCEIRAPYDGRVREEHVDVGQFVNRGSPVARLYAVDFAEVRLPVPDDQLAFLDLPLGVPADADSRPLPEVIFHAEFAGAERSWHGRVVRTEGEIDPRTRMIHVVARVEDPYRRLSAAVEGVPLAVGLFVEAEVLGREAHDVVVLPRSALRDGDVAFVVDEAGRLRFRQVEVLRRERSLVVIRAGLEAGERIVVSPLAAPVDGMRVRIENADAQGDRS